MNDYIVTLTNKENIKVIEIKARDEREALYEIPDFNSGAWDECNIELVDKNDWYKEYTLHKGCRRKFERIVVEYQPDDFKDKPYFSIKYEENGKHIIGFSTYNPEVLSKYIQEYFITPTIIEAESDEKPNKWIPVSSERLPKNNELVLFSTKTNEVFEGRYFADDTDCQWYAYRDENFVPNHYVTAWMPKPESYKVESEDEA